MAPFYDAMNEADLVRVENLLRANGIEYFIDNPVWGSVFKEIKVAEEDMVAAEAALEGC